MSKTYKDRRKQFTSEDYQEIAIKKKQSKKFRKNRNKDLTEKVAKIGIML